MATAALLGGCGGDRRSPLADELCGGGVAPEGFYVQDQGAFSDENLREPGAGIEAGYYSFLREDVDRPPITPPVEVVCQVMRFPDEGAAAAYIEDLTDNEASAPLGVFREPRVVRTTVTPLADERLELAGWVLLALEAEERGDREPGPLYALTAQDGELVHLVIIDRPLAPLRASEAADVAGELFAGRAEELP